MGKRWSDVVLVVITPNGLEHGHPDRAIGGDEQQVALTPAEREVHRARQLDLPQQVALGAVHLDAAE
jgi:hypothetical protein